MIYPLHHSPRMAAALHNDPHVRDLPEWLRHLLSAVWWKLEPREAIPASASPRHALRVLEGDCWLGWACLSSATYHWVQVYAKALCREHRFRFMTDHPQEGFIDDLVTIPLKLVRDRSWHQFPITPVPEQFRVAHDVVLSYQQWYAVAAKREYTTRLAPEFIRSLL